MIQHQKNSSKKRHRGPAIEMNTV